MTSHLKISSPGKICTEYTWTGSMYWHCSEGSKDGINGMWLQKQQMPEATAVSLPAAGASLHEQSPTLLESGTWLSSWLGPQHSMGLISICSQFSCVSPEFSVYGGPDPDLGYKVGDWAHVEEDFQLAEELRKNQAECKGVIHSEYTRWLFMSKCLCTKCHD